MYYKPGTMLRTSHFLEVGHEEQEEINISLFF